MLNLMRRWSVGGEQGQVVSGYSGTHNLLSSTLSITQYSIDVQPSIVIHWNTVNMAKPMLSKLVMPWFGPSHFSRHMLVLLLHTKEPVVFSVMLSVLQGVSDSPSFTNLSVRRMRIVSFGTDN